MDVYKVHKRAHATASTAEFNDPLEVRGKIESTFLNI
jgi:hypothetical protein